MASNMVQVCGEVIEEIPIKDNGSLVSHKVMVFIHG